MIGRINFTGDQIGPQICFVATAIIGSGVVGAGAGIYSANQAKKAQLGATGAALNQQKQQFGVAEDALQPFIQSGESYLPQIKNMLQPGNSQAALEQLPGYQFTLQQGEKAVTNAAAAKGLGASGAALKGASRFATGLADSTFGDQFNRLLAASQQGSTAAGQLAGNAVTSGNSMANTITGGGNAAAGADIAAGNAVGAGASSVGTGILLNQLIAKSNNTGIPGGGTDAWGNIRPQLNQQDQIAA